MAVAKMLRSIVERTAAAVTLTRGDVRAGKTLQSVFERSAAAVTLMPSVGQGTDTTTVRLREGTTCDVEEGSWQFVSDAEPELGGSEEHPDPGFYLRAALGTCFVQTAVLWAAHYSVPLTRLDVEVEADHDARGLLGVENRGARFTGLRYRITVESPAPAEDVQRVLDATYAHSPVHDSLQHAFTIEREEEIVAPVE